jgi:hypothetical protein
MAKTLSETLFEKFCSNSGITLVRVPEEQTPTPDYELIVEGQRIIVEVKEITSNKEEQESDRLLIERGYGNVRSRTPGERVRKKISASSPQIKSRMLGTFPSILVLYDGRNEGHLWSDNIRVAMYGLEQINIAVPMDRSKSPYAMGMSYGPKRKMTEQHNTSISAIGVLYTPNSADIDLYLYHNRFAMVALDPKILQRYGIRQFILGKDVPGRTAQWE